MELPESILDTLKSREATTKDIELINNAYVFSKKAHEGQTRYSGEPYFNHAVRVAENLTEFGVDINTLASGFLHDTIEDCDITAEEIEKIFNKDVTNLVRGVSKLGSLRYKGRDRYAENLRHLFVATAADVRVILIKIADRLDNIRTLEYVPKNKQKRIALETLEIYAQIANKLGMNQIKPELEDRAFPYVNRIDYEKVRTLIKERGGERKKYIGKVYRSLVKLLASNDMRDVQVDYRIKGTYSIYHKLLKHDMDVAKLYDLYALRVIVPQVEDCYKILGIIHSMWKPVPGRIKDYISNPKINGYKSLHTTVFTGDGGVAEIQVRTDEMNREAEYGIAAHLIYKDGKHRNRAKNVKGYLSWLRHLEDVHRESEKPKDYLTNIKKDFFDERINLFTPLVYVI